MVAKSPKRRVAAEPSVIADRGDGAHPPAQAKAIIILGKRASGKRTRVKIGGVYVTSEKASADQVKHSVSKSTDMLQRLGQKIARPGVRLKTARDIPLFSIDPKHPDRFLRKLNGRIERGVLVNGVFKVVD